MRNFIKDDFKLMRTYKSEVFEVLTLFMVIIILALGLINFIQQQNTNTRNIKQVKQIAMDVEKLTQQQQEISAKASATRTQQLQTISQELQCIGDFFAQTDRTNLTVTNLNSCTIAAAKTTALVIPNTSPTLTPSSVSEPPAQSKVSQSSSSPQSAPNNSQSQSQSTASSPAPAPKPSVIRRILNFVGL